MTTRAVRPSNVEPFDIRCGASDALVANLAVHVVFFFARRLDTTALSRAFTRALETLPLFAGRMSWARGGMLIRCAGQGVPFTHVSSELTMNEAIRSVADDGGLWLVDRVDGIRARWGWGPVCKVRVTHLADDTTAIGFSWHHALGDMQTAMYFMNAWADAGAGRPPAQPLIVEDRGAYLDERLPAETAREPGLRCLGLAEVARTAVHLARAARGLRTVRVYFGEDEIARMRADFASRTSGDRRLSVNDVLCAQIAETITEVDPEVDRRTLAIVVNARNRCGLDPMLIGNIIAVLKLDVGRGEAASSIAQRVRQAVDDFTTEHCDLLTNQRVLDDAGPWRSTWCASTILDPDRWNQVLTNWSGFGVYRLRFEDTPTFFFTPVIDRPVAGIGLLVDGAGGRGLFAELFLPAREFETISQPRFRERLHRFREPDDDIPLLHRELYG